MLMSNMVKWSMNSVDFSHHGSRWTRWNSAMSFRDAAVHHLSMPEAQDGHHMVTVCDCDDCDHCDDYHVLFIDYSSILNQLLSIQWCFWFTIGEQLIHRWTNGCGVHRGDLIRMSVFCQFGKVVASVARLWVGRSSITTCPKDGHEKGTLAFSFIFWVLCDSSTCTPITNDDIINETDSIKDTINETDSTHHSSALFQSNRPQSTRSHDKGNPRTAFGRCRGYFMIFWMAMWLNPILTELGSGLYSIW